LCPRRQRRTAPRAQVEGGFVQGLGWCCLEELVWGDGAHPWVPPGTLHTRGPGAPPLPRAPHDPGRRGDRLCSLLRSAVVVA